MLRYLKLILNEVEINSTSLSKGIYLMKFLNATEPDVGSWQFLTTGAVMGCSLLVLAELQWDMRSPIDYDLLSPKQKQFNQEQDRLRQINI